MPRAWITRITKLNFIKVIQFGEKTMYINPRMNSVTQKTLVFTF